MTIATLCFILFGAWQMVSCSRLSLVSPQELILTCDDLAAQVLTLINVATGKITTPSSPYLVPDIGELHTTLNVMFKDDCRLRWYYCAKAGPNYYDLILGDEHLFPSDDAYQMLFRETVERIVRESHQLVFMLWVTANINAFGGYRAIWWLLQSTILVPSHLHAYGHVMRELRKHHPMALPNRLHADIAVMEGRTDLLWAFSQEGVYPTASGIKNVINQYLSHRDASPTTLLVNSHPISLNIIKWCLERGVKFDKGEVIHLMARHHLIGIKYFPYGDQKHSHVCTLLRLFHEFDVELGGDVADMFCPFGTPEIMALLLGQGKSPSHACLSLAASSANIPVLRWYANYVEQRSHSLMARPKLLIGDFEFNMAAYWGDLELLDFVCLFREDPPLAFFNIAAHRGNVGFLRQIASRLSGPLSIQFKWLHSMKDLNLRTVTLELMDDFHIDIGPNDFKSAVMAGNESWLLDHLDLSNAYQMLDLANIAISHGHLGLMTRFRDAAKTLGKTCPEWAFAWRGALEHADVMKWLITDDYDRYIQLSQPDSLVNHLIDSPVECCRLFAERFQVYPSATMNVEILKWLLAEEQKLDFNIELIDDRRRNLLVEAGYVPVLGSPGFVPSSDSIDVACGRGHWDLIKRLGKGALPTENGAQLAASSGHLEIMRWIISKGIAPSRVCADKAWEHGHYEMGVFLLPRCGGGPSSVTHIRRAIQDGYLDLIRLCHDLNGQEITNLAILSGSIHVSSYVEKHLGGILPDQPTVDLVIQEGNYLAATWLESHHLLPTVKALSQCPSSRLRKWLVQKYPLTYGTLGWWSRINKLSSKTHPHHAHLSLNNRLMSLVLETLNYTHYSGMLPEGTTKKHPRGLFK